MKEKKKKILVVDDEREMRIFLSTLLESGGFEPILAADENEGLEKAGKEKPDLIILDLMISAAGVIQMYAPLVIDEKLNKIPVIMLSTIDERTFSHYRKMQNIPSESGKGKPDVFMEKPPEAEELLRLLYKLIKNKEGDMR